jgi:Mrp family chromosome partitioning ATPase
VRTLAELPARTPDEVRRGTLRRSDLSAFAEVLGEIGQGPVLLVTGAGEGPRAASVGLASAAAARGRETVLVDCDLSAPSIASTLGLDEEPGLHEYLRAQAKAPEILQALALAGPAAANATRPLVCIAAGEPAEVGTAPIDSEHFRHAVAKLRSGYDLVVLHGPPVGDGSGALRAIAEEADVLLACVGRNLAGGRDGRRLKRTLKALPVDRVAGVVVYG